MLEVTILASGSAGNSALVRCGDTRILVDAGLSARRLCERLTACGIRPEALDGILLTHEHSDHTSALRVLCAKNDIPVYANRMTSAALQAASLAEHRHWRLFSTGAPFAIGQLSIEAFQVPHDAADPVGFVIRNTTTSFGVLTDLGYATRLVLERLRDIDALLIETNHDEALLQNDLRRPWSVKQRILSRHGHLSNTAAASVIGELAGNRLAQLFLGHLSQDCNTPRLAIDAVASELQRHGHHGIAIHCARQSTCSPAFRIGSTA